MFTSKISLYQVVKRSCLSTLHRQKGFPAFSSRVPLSWYIRMFYILKFNTTRHPPINITRQWGEEEGRSGVGSPGLTILPPPPRLPLTESGLIQARGWSGVTWSGYHLSLPPLNSRTDASQNLCTWLVKYVLAMWETEILDLILNLKIGPIIWGNSCVL